MAPISLASRRTVHPVILDWGDCTIGHPVADILTRALALMKPLEPLRGAIIYSGFLTAIEPAELPYHAADPLRCLSQAAHVIN